MLFKTLLPFALVAALSIQVQGHALITPALGVKGKGVRDDVQRPSNNQPCGNVNIAKNIDSSTPAVAGADGSFTLTVTNFNGGKDGSREVGIKVDGDASGKKFVNAKVTKNGQGNPSNVGSEQITATLPAGTKCTGGKNKNLCLASVTTTAGFGNCVVIQQGGNGKAGRDVLESTVEARSDEGGDETESQLLVVGTRAPRYVRRWGTPS